ncbi:MAG: hypothetical protein WA061_01985 [Microgenomates group bacterium]
MGRYSIGGKIEGTKANRIPNFIRTACWDLGLDVDEITTESSGWFSEVVYFRVSSDELDLLDYFKKKVTEAIENHYQ